MKLQFYISNQEIEKSNKMVQKIKVEGINYSAIYWTYIYIFKEGYINPFVREVNNFSHKS